MNCQNDTLSSAELLQQIKTLHEMLAAKDSAIAAKDSAIAEQNSIIEQLSEQVRLLKALEYARSSEKKRPQTQGESRACQLWLFDEAEFLARSSQDFNILPDGHEVARCDMEVSSSVDATEDDNSAKSRKKRGRKPLSPQLPREDVLVDIPDEAKVCPCGCALKRIGEEISEKLQIIPQKIVVKRTIRPKYACPACEGTEDSGPTVKIAAPPPAIIPKGIATPSLLAYIFMAKFGDALPFYRQTGIFRRFGAEISRGTMSSWTSQAAKICEPLMELLLEHLRAGPLINIDETPVQVLREKDRENTTKSYMWVARGGPDKQPILLFRYAPSRAGAVACDIVGPNFSGYLQSDGYAGYTTLGERGGIVHVGCLAHVRRKFVDVIKASPKKGGLAGTVVDLMAKLYHHESVARKQNLDAAKLLALREEKIRPILNNIKTRLREAAPTVPPQSLLGKAIGYALGQWPRIEAYLGDACLTPDNNAAENAIRPFAVGRKNWLFAGSPRGAAASATLYSLIETAKVNSINPHEYLLHLFENMPKITNKTELNALLPWNVNLPVRNS